MNAVACLNSRGTGLLSRPVTAEVKWPSIRLLTVTPGVADNIAAAAAGYPAC